MTAGIPQRLLCCQSFLRSHKAVPSSHRGSRPSSHFFISTMSLRHILNDEPLTTHSRQSYPSPSRIVVGEQHAHPGKELSPPLRSPTLPYSSQRLASGSHDSRPYYRPVPYDVGWDSRSADRTPDEHPSYASERSYERDRVASPAESETVEPKEEEVAVASKKRRRGGHQDSEYLPTKGKRVSFSSVPLFFRLMI